MTQPIDAPAPVVENEANKISEGQTNRAAIVAPSDIVQSLLSPKQYNILKWVVMLVLPAVTTFYGTFSNIWGWPYGDQIVASLAAFTLLLGVIIGVSTVSYNKSSSGPAGTLVIDHSTQSLQTYLAFDQDPKTLPEGSQVTFNVAHSN